MREQADQTLQNLAFADCYVSQKAQVGDDVK